MFKKIIKLIHRIIKLALLLGLVGLILPRLVTALYAAPRINSVEEAPARRVGIVFGAGLWRDGTPTPVLRDRVATAAQLYFSGKIEKILMSGDNRFLYYNEPGAMRDYALGLGVPSEAIVMDYAGRRTYDTCYRAREIFGLKEVILITQRFHLPRALYTCKGLGINALGVDANQREYRRSSLFYWNLRELPATLTMLFEVYLLKPLPVLGNPEPIFPDAQ